VRYPSKRERAGFAEDGWVGSGHPPKPLTADILRRADQQTFATSVTGG